MIELTNPLKINSMRMRDLSNHLKMYKMMIDLLKLIKTFTKMTIGQSNR